DFHYMHSPKKAQLWAFESFLEMATSLDLPLIVHSREAFTETLALLTKYAPHLPRGGVIHSFTQGWEEAQTFLDLNFYLSFPGVFTFPKAEKLRQVASLAPLNRILLETDAPFMTPVPFRGQPNEPAFLVYHLKALAEARGISLGEAAKETTANARRLFNRLL
ncbi:MAG: TatD family hydrolase, partial [Candidatus Adiutrix sp.]